MAGGQNDTQARMFLTVSRYNAPHGPFFEQKINHFGVETYLTARPQNCFAQGRDHGGEFVGTDVRVGIHQNLFGCPVRHQDLQNPPNVAAFAGSGVEFPVRIGTGPTFAKTIVRFGIHHVVFVDGGQIAPPRPHIRPAFQHHRFQAQFNQPQGGKQPCRASSHNDHGVGLAHVRVCQTVPNQGRWCFTGIHVGLHVDTYLAAARIDGLAAFAHHHVGRVGKTELVEDKGAEGRVVQTLFGAEGQAEVLMHELAGPVVIRQRGGKFTQKKGCGPNHKPVQFTPLRRLLLPKKLRRGGFQRGVVNKALLETVRAGSIKRVGVGLGQRGVGAHPGYQIGVGNERTAKGN